MATRASHTCLLLRAAKRTGAAPAGGSTSASSSSSSATSSQVQRGRWLPPWPLMALTAVVGVVSGFYIFQPLLSQAAASRTTSSATGSTSSAALAYVWPLPTIFWIFVLPLLLAPPPLMHASLVVWTTPQEHPSSSVRVR